MTILFKARKKQMRQRKVTTKIRGPKSRTRQREARMQRARMFKNVDVVNLPPMYGIHIQSSILCAVLFLLRKGDEVALKNLPDKVNIDAT